MPAMVMAVLRWAATMTGRDTEPRAGTRNHGQGRGTVEAAERQPRSRPVPRQPQVPSARVK
ncbi:hypothetical protein STXM2123_3430 [Streptomyces sp. F-3]|nr:hypothetical protein STXM2123_3430 [Streptomyces sp. F-3]